MFLRRVSLAALLLLAVFSVSTAGEESSDPWRILLSPVVADGAEPPTGAIVPRRASYAVAVAGTSAMGTVIQEFVNDGDSDIDMTYLGLAPRGVVPLGFELEIEGLVVEDALAPAPEPKPEPAGRGRSRRARPKPIDVQTQITRPFSVPAGGTVVVRSSFEIQLPLDDDVLRLRLPAVWYGAGPAGAAALEGAVTPATGDIEITVLHGQPLSRLRSTTHDILSGFDEDRTWVELSGRDETSRPFEMTFAIGREDEPTLSAFVGGERDGARDVTVLFTPAIEPSEEAIRAKQLMLVLDTSGSMREDKILNAKTALASCLDKLGSADQLNMVEFDGGFTLFAPGPVHAHENLGAAHAWLERQEAEGNTLLMPALEAILEQPASPDHHRMIVTLTDGGIRDEKAALELLKEKLGDARLFVVGIGKNVQQDTILRLSEYGRGTAVFVDDPKELETAVSGLFDSISQPVAWDLELDWGAAEVETIGTERVPDLYAARPVTVRARVRGELPDEVLLRVTTTEGTKTFRTLLPELTPAIPGR